MKTYGGNVYIYIYRCTFFLTSTLVRGEWSASYSCRFTLGERAHSTHWIGSCVEPRDGLTYLEKRQFLILPGVELRPLSIVQPVTSRYTDYATRFNKPTGITVQVRRNLGGSLVIGAAEVRLLTSSCEHVAPRRYWPVMRPMPGMLFAT
jgi:hypothetical protein